MPKEVINVAHVGCGYWGLNLIRNIKENPKAELVAVADPDSSALRRIKRKYPGVAQFKSLEETLAQKTIDAVVIATPSGFHYEQALEAMKAGKHVFVEKPMASSVEQAKKLVKVANDTGLILMVGHTFLYNNLVHEVKKYIDRGDLGEILYVYSQRLNLGRFRYDSDVLWTLAPHDVSILNYWFKSRPYQVSARGLVCIGKEKNFAEVCFAQLDYPDGKYAHLHMSWLDPQKIRQIVVVGNRKMLIYDDMNAERHIQIFDKRVERNFHKLTADFDEFTTRLRAGDLVIPNIQLVEPLSVEIDHFIDCVKNKTLPLTHGWHGLEVTVVMDSLMRSMRENGLLIPVEYPQTSD